jgi:hypothetical protein
MGVLLKEVDRRLLDKQMDGTDAIMQWMEPFLEKQGQNTSR